MQLAPALLSAGALRWVPLTPAVAAHGHAVFALARWQVSNWPVPKHEHEEPPVGFVSVPSCWGMEDVK